MGSRAAATIALMFEMVADLNGQENGTGNTVLHTAVHR